MQMINRPYLDFYGKHGISPVAKEIDSENHFVQRRALYHHLGILPECVRESKVLEFGPGNGVNAVYTISLDPVRYVLVDANSTGIENCKKNLNHFCQGKDWQVIDSLIEEYETDEQFDLVICEGLLPNQVDPSQMARHCASFVNGGGLFVLTCHDMISTVSETLRCLLGALLIKEIRDFDEQVNLLSGFFESHLSHLKGMTRTNEEWVIDNILNNEFWKDAPLFSIAEAVEALEGDFIAHATSPRFLQDWSWYKSVGDIESHFNTVLKESYWENAHNFIDWRIVSHPRSESDNLALYGVCKSIRGKVREAAVDDATIGTVIKDCQKLLLILPEGYSDTKVAVDSYIDGMKSYLKNSKIKPEIFQDFGAWWGRGMQYVSFVKQ